MHTRKYLGFFILLGLNPISLFLFPLLPYFFHFSLSESKYNSSFYLYFLWIRWLFILTIFLYLLQTWEKSNQIKFSICLLDLLWLAVVSFHKFSANDGSIHRINLHTMKYIKHVTIKFQSLIKHSYVNSIHTKSNTSLPTT